jgi:hypothetical protein
LNPAAPFWVRAVVLGAPPLLCAASAASTLLLARRAEAQLGSSPELAELEKAQRDAQKLLGGEG